MIRFLASVMPSFSVKRLSFYVACVLIGCRSRTGLFYRSHSTGHKYRSLYVLTYNQEGKCPIGLSISFLARSLAIGLGEVICLACLKTIIGAVICSW